MTRRCRPRRYFSLHFRMLRVLGLGWWHHADEGDTSNFPPRYLPYCLLTQLVWVVGFVGLETIHPFVATTARQDLDRFMFSLSFVITHDLTLIKLYLFYFRNKEIQHIVHSLEIELHAFYQNNETIRKTIKTTKIMTGSFLFFGWATIASSTINGAIQDLRWKAAVSRLHGNETRPTRTLAQPIFIPWDYQEERAFVATFILEAVGILWTGHIVMIIDTFIGSVILHMSCQFRILQEAFSSVYSRAMRQLAVAATARASRSDEAFSVIARGEQSDTEAEVFVRARCSAADIEAALYRNITEAIKQHQALIRCVEKFSATYSPGFLTQLLSSMAAICVVMVQVAKDASSLKSMSFATSLAFFFAMIIQLAIQCITGNELTLQAQLVAESVVASRWERMSPRLRRMLLLVIARAQKPLALSAAGFVHMDISCFLSIVKAAYSYYAVLSQKQK